MLVLFGNQHHRLHIIVLVLICLLFTMAATTRRGFPMPDVSGLTVNQAEGRVAAAGKTIGATGAIAEVLTREDSRPAGQIIEQLTQAGTIMYPSTHEIGGNYGKVFFKVVISSGPRLAPDFIDKTELEASLLARKNRVRLVNGGTQRNARKMPGIIFRQDPAPRSPMKAPVVTVYVSGGYPLPNYSGQSLRTAQMDARKLGFELDTQHKRDHSSSRGIILDQKPAPGTLLPVSGPVTLIVSAGYPMPELVGLPESTADEIALKYSLKLDKSRAEKFDIPSGQVFSQAPPPTDFIPENRTARIAISEGYPLPDLTGSSESHARSLAGRLGFTLAISHGRIRNREAGLINEQFPAPGTRLPLNDPVEILVSDGWPTPDFVGKDEPSAKLLASENEVSLAITESRQDRSAPAGVILAQSPSPGELLPPGQAVSLVISEGYPTPSFLNLSENDAFQLANREHITLGLDYSEHKHIAVGLVIFQSPLPGMPLPADGRVSATVSTGWPVPNFVGMSQADAAALADNSQIVLIPNSSQESYRYPARIIMEQQPPYGEQIPENREVQFTLSLGWPIAPDALGHNADDIEAKFLSTYPNAQVSRESSYLTFKPAGYVVSQQPSPGAKLGLDQQLTLTRATEKPLWFWPLIGLFIASGTVATFGYKRLRPPVEPSNNRSNIHQDPSGIRLRVSRDPGTQAISFGEQSRPDHEYEASQVHINVTVDLGIQSVIPVNDSDNGGTQT